jgi:hypothetical protein
MLMLEQLLAVAHKSQGHEHQLVLHAKRSRKPTPCPHTIGSVCYT